MLGSNKGDKQSGNVPASFSPAGSGGHPQSIYDRCGNKSSPIFFSHQINLLSAEESEISNSRRKGEFFLEGAPPKYMPSSLLRAE